MTIAEGNNRYRQIIEDAVAEAVGAEGRPRNCWSEGKEIFGVRSQVGRRRAAEHERALRCAAGRVSYPTQAEAEAHILEKFDPRYHDHYHVESRAVKKSDEGKRMHCQACGRARKCE